MGEIGETLSGILSSIVASVVMLVISILSFFVTVFVIVAGAGMAGYHPDANFVVLSATILAATAVLSGIYHEE